MMGRCRQEHGLVLRQQRVAPVAGGAGVGDALPVVVKDHRGMVDAHGERLPSPSVGGGVAVALAAHKGIGTNHGGIRQAIAFLIQFREAVVNPDWRGHSSAP